MHRLCLPQPAGPASVHMSTGPAAVLSGCGSPVSRWPWSRGEKRDSLGLAGHGGGLEQSFADGAVGGGGAGRLISGEPVSAAKDYVDQVNAAVDGIVLAELMGIGFLLGLVSSAAGIVFILRYEPLQILAERS